MMSEQEALTHVKILSAEEPESLIKLADGTQISARLILSSVFRVDGEHDAQGNQSYRTNWQITSTIIPVKSQGGRLS